MSRTKFKNNALINAAKVFISINILLPIIFGILIYIFFRDVRPYPIKYSLELIGLDDIGVLRTFGDGAINYWFVYCLPDGLWAYSLTYFIMSINKYEDFKIKGIYLVATYAIILFQEMFQGSFLKGTFDVYDMVNINLGFFIALVVFYRNTGALK